eukprot:7137061-Pyramimonas_sp.AAC.1
MAVPSHSPYPSWDEGLADKALSARTLPPLASSQLPYGSQPPCNGGFPHAVWLAHIFWEISGVCEGAHAASCVSVRVQAAVKLGIVWAPPSGSRYSQETAGRLTDGGLVSARSKGSERGYVSVRPACRPPLGPIQASRLVRTPMRMDQELSSNKIYTGCPLGGHVATLLLVDASGAPLSSYPGWLIRYLVGAVRSSRSKCTDTFCHGGVGCRFIVPPVGVPWL